MYLMLGDNLTLEQAEAAIDEYYLVRGQLIELYRYYLLVCEMGGVRHVADIHMGDAYRAERMKESHESFTEVWALVRRIDQLSSTDPITLAHEWPGVLEALEDYSFDYVEVATGVEHRVNERFEDLRLAARGLGVNLAAFEEEVANRTTNPGGAPGGPRSFPDETSFLLSVKKAIEITKASRKGMNQENIALAWLNQQGRGGRKDEVHTNPGYAIVRTAKFFKSDTTWAELQKRAMES